MANTTGDLNVDIGATLTKLDKALKDLGGKFDKANKGVQSSAKQSSGKVESSWTTGLNKIAYGMAAAFSVKAIAAFAKESFLMAASLEGIENAFNRIGSKKVFDDLQKATAGTVSQLDLMKAAVQASNFQIPVDKLASLFEFARRRAKETGESVDYLVNSIVLGIGRKSPLILDNLGISAVRLREELKGVGVESATVADITEIVGRIAQEEMGKMGEEVESSADEVQRLAAEFDNLKIAIGQRLVQAITGGNGKLADMLSYLTKIIKKGEFLSGGLISDLETIQQSTYDKAKGGLEELIKKYGSVENVISKLKETSEQWRKTANKPIKTIGIFNENTGRWDDQTEKIKNQNRILNAQAQAYMDLAKELQQALDAKNALNKESQKEIDLQNQLLKAQNIYQAAKAAGLNNGTITGPGNALANVTPEDLAGLQAFIDQDLAGIENLDAASAEFFAKRQTDLQNLSSASMFFGASLTNAFRKSMDEGADFGDVLGKMLEDVIKQLLAAAAAAFALSVIMASFGMGGFGLAKGASFSQLFTAGFGNMSGLGLSSSNLGMNGGSNKMSIQSGEFRLQGDTAYRQIQIGTQNNNRWNNGGN